MVLQNYTGGMQRLSVSMSLLLLAAFFSVKEGVAGSAAPVEVRAHLAQMPVCFEANEGLAAPEIKYISRSQALDVFLAADTVTMVAKTLREDDGVRQRVIRVSLVDARADAAAGAMQKMSGTVNYLNGADPSLWRTDVPLHGGVRFREVYPGIDVLYYGTRGRLEYDFFVSPGADPARIALRVQGTEGAALTPEGDLALRLDDRIVTFLAPEAYQQSGGERHSVQSRYVLGNDGTVSFEFGCYDPALTLVIDPVVELSSLVGLPSSDARGVGVDAQGNMYIAGQTSLGTLELPGTHMDTTLGGDSDIFVVKFDPTGQQIVYASYIGGSDKESGKCMYVDAQGCAYIGGNTKSRDLPSANFIDHPGSTYDLLVVKVNSEGNGLGYCCVFGGEGMEEFRGITVDAWGNCIAVGGSHSPDLPTTSGSYQPVYKDPPETTPDVAGSFTQGEDAVIAKIAPDGRSFVFLTWLGGHGFEKAWAVTTDGAGDIYVAGHVEATDFPVTEGAFQPRHGGGTPRGEDQYGPKDAFVAKLSADGSRALSATYFGGGGQDVGYGVGVDTEGNVYVAGNTESPDLPVLNAPYSQYGGGESDVFVAKLDPSLSRLLYATFFGGSGKDELASDGFVVDENGYAYAAGSAGSQVGTVRGALSEAYLGGGSDGLFARFKPNGQVDYATLIGGSESDKCGDIALDKTGGVYLCGTTGSYDFRTVRPYRAGGIQKSDVFLLKIQFGNNGRDSKED